MCRPVIPSVYVGVLTRCTHPRNLAVRIRQAVEGDHQAIAAINRRAWSGGITTGELIEQRHGPIDGRSWIEHTVDAVAAHMRQPDVTTFVAEVEGRIVGYAAAQVAPPASRGEMAANDMGIVSYNAVDPDYQGQGIGTALIQRVLSYLQEQGARVLAVWTLEADEPVRRIYERLGFEELTRFVYYTRPRTSDCP